MYACNTTLVNIMPEALKKSRLLQANKAKLVGLKNLIDTIDLGQAAFCHCSLSLKHLHLVASVCKDTNNLVNNLRASDIRIEQTIASQLVTRRGSKLKPNFNMIKYSHWKFCLNKAINRIERDVRAFRTIPRFVFTKQVVLQALRKNHRYLKYVARPDRKDEIALEAIKACPLNLGYISVSNRTQELIDTVKQLRFQAVKSLCN